MNDRFSETHPLVNLIFFACAVLFSMFLMHPVCLIISLVCALVYAVFTGGRRTVLFSLLFLLPSALLIMIINPLTNHRGATILRYLPWDNPLTLESIIYGAASAAMLCAVVLWFSCVNRVMTSDKLVFLFGSVVPALSLVLSMALRFVPRFFARFREVRRAQGQFYSRNRSLAARFKGGLRVLSVMLSWSMENAVETADSMKSRGYGLKGRSAFPRFCFHTFDFVLITVMLLDAAALCLLIALGLVRFRYYPFFRGNFTDGFSLLFYALYALLLLTPMIFNAKEGIRWKLSQSKI